MPKAPKSSCEICNVSAYILIDFMFFFFYSKINQILYEVFLCVFFLISIIVFKKMIILYAAMTKCPCLLSVVHTKYLNTKISQVTDKSNCLLPHNSLQLAWCHH